MTVTDIMASRTDKREYTEDGRKMRLVVTSRLYQLEGNPRPYFSVTCDEYERRGSRWVDIGGGAAHELIVRKFPQLAPVILVHLADDRGVPMHAVANAIYWAGFSSWGGKDFKPMSPRDKYGRHEIETDETGLEWAPEVFARHLRVTIERARELRAYVAADPHPIEAMHFICKNLETQWQAEADWALEVIKLGRDYPDQD